MDKKIKILIVDDSRIFRFLIETALKGVDVVEVAGSVRNGVKAIEFIKSTHVDLVTLDFEMPDMDGLQTLKAIQELNASKLYEHNIGAIMISSFTQAGADVTIKALEGGAFDFITKPKDDTVEQNKAALRQQLLEKIRIFTKRSGGHKAPTTKPKQPTILKPKSVINRTLHGVTKAILIGISTGGPKALLEMLPGLSDKVDLPVFIVQHMPPNFTLSLAKSLDSKCRHTVVECTDNDTVKNDHIYIAQGGKHMALRKNGGLRITTVTNEDPPENGCRPSVDVLFRSAAQVYGKDVITVIMTGMGADGVKGLGPLKEAGAYTIAQNEESSVVWGMPGSAVKAGVIDEVVALNGIADAVSAAVR